MNRTFHQKFTLASKCGITIFTLLAFYLFMVKEGLLGVLVIIVVVGMIERVLHTEYRFEKDKDGEWLVIDKGRFSRNKVLKIDEIVKCTSMKTVLGLSHYLLIQEGVSRFYSVQPQNDSEFIAELKKRQEK